jgi:predicted transcriptional regulator
MTTHKVIVGSKQKKSQLQLPTDTADLLKTLSMTDRKAYVKRLCLAGWTYQSVADVFKVSRQAIEQYLKKVDVASDYVNGLPIPEVPSDPIYKVQRQEVNSVVLLELKELHDKAKLVRGKGKKYRHEAELFTKLAWEQTQQGVSVYSLAKSLGVTHGALLFRFVRYGYTTSESQSKVFRKLTNREVIENGDSSN